MKDYDLPKYDKQRDWIVTARKKRNMTWESIYYGMGRTLKDLELFLNNQKIMSFWDVDVEDWKKLVQLEKEGEEKLLKISAAEKSAIISDGDKTNDAGVPTLPSSCWQKYRHYLLNEQHFRYEDVRAIENSSIRILRRMNSDTKGKAVKGLVVGNVQSGKTANMAALMAMAADHGYNMFVILSGTIENLRIQTLNRLINDLNLNGCNLTWVGVPHPAVNCEKESKAQNLNFEPGNPTRNLTVCLKNSSRLKDLIQWMHEDKNSARQMKVLVIDDESDQAGINTRNVDSDERTKINQLIVNLVGNKDEKNDAVEDTFQAMNYIGYTATPYANVLNEAGSESLYPRDFISTLQVSKTYFGPQQIFGDRSSGNYKGLDIVREVSFDEVSEIKAIHKDFGFSVPEGLEHAICWFLCCVATRRIWNSKKPVSMLIHTSQITSHHEQIHKLIKMWFDAPKKEIAKKCKEVWENETAAFTKTDLFNDYPEFAVDQGDVNDYPQFNEIENELNSLIEQGIENISLGEKGIMEYKKGVHICVDNCKNNGAQADGTYMRLAYPDKKTKLDYAPAFLVIGGATLSRGLTIEGLVSTYFLRSTKQGDTLMQMGRWFGYRRGYELLQRIWITDNALHQFEFLSDMDSELREYISQMELFGKSPSEYAVVVTQSPSTKLLKISAKNRIQSAIPTEMNYSGMHSQTQLFKDDIGVLKSNYVTAENFIESLGTGHYGDGALGKNSVIWRNVSFDTIYDRLLNKYIFHDKLIAFSDIDALKVWVNEVTNDGALTDWNVILFGIEGSRAKTSFAGYEIGRVKRTRKRLRENTIDLGVLADPKEKVADVEYCFLPDDAKKLYDNYRTSNAQAIRKAAGLNTTPSIAIYVVDKYSRATAENSRRYDLNTECDIVGISINVPGDRINSNYAKSVIIDLKKYGIGSDIEGEEDNEN